MKPSPLKTRWLQLSGKIDRLSTRERGIVLLMSLAVLYMLWDFAIFNPLTLAKTEVDSNLTAVDQKINSMEQEERAILLAVNADPDRELKQQLAGMETELTELDQALAELSLGLIPVNQLSEILYTVLQKTGQLQLQVMRTLPVEEISLVSERVSENTDLETKAGAGVYKHQVQLKVKGNYRQLLTYLDQLEQLNWRFYWDELRFEEDQYPNALIELKVYTLSTDEGLFGV